MTIFLSALAVLALLACLMSSEVSYSARLSITDAGQTLSGDTSKTLSLDTPGEKFANVQALTTSLADISLGSDITWSEVSVLWLKNKSTTTGEIITIAKSTIEMCVIPPGEVAVFRPKQDGTAMRAKSATGTPQLQVVAAGQIA